MPAFQRERLRAKIGAITCSDSWTEHVTQSAERHGVQANAANVATQLRERGIYPPRSDPGRDDLPRTRVVRMRRCDACGRIVPPNNVATYRMVRLCDDCRFEPDVDPDELADHDKMARAPGAQLNALVEGLVNDDANRQSAREQMHQIGLTDSEITVMSLALAGFSTRRIADMLRCSQAYVRKVFDSAARKLRRSGLRVPRPATETFRQRLHRLDPSKLDAMTEGAAYRTA